MIFPKCRMAGAFNRIQSRYHTTDFVEIDPLIKMKYKNPKIGYLNINILQNKIVDLRSIIHDIDFTFLAIAETKLNDSYTSAQF